MCVWIEAGQHVAAARVDDAIVRPGRGSAPIAAMRPSRIDTSPSTMSQRSFIVTIVPPRISSDDMAQTFRHFRLQMRFQPCDLSVGGVHRIDGGCVLAVLDGDQLGEDADGDLLRRDGADVEADRRVHARQRLGRHPVRRQRVVDARDLGAAADQAEVAQLARRQRAQRLEIVGVAARDDHDVGVRRQSACARARPGCRRRRSRRRSGKRSRLANFSRSSTTWTRKPTSCASRARWKPTWPAPMM